MAYAASTLVPAGTLGAISTADPKMSIVYHINIMDLNSGKNILTSSPIPELIFSLSWNEDGRRLAGESQFSSVYIWDANNLNQISSFSVSNQVTGRFAYSPYGGVLAIGVNSKQSSSLRINQALPTKNVFPIANNAVQIVVPEASSERLKSITQACGLQPNVQEVLIYQINANDLNTFKTHVSTLTNTDIPVGCQADLLAVADALLEK